MNWRVPFAQEKKWTEDQPTQKHKTTNTTTNTLAFFRGVWWTWKKKEMPKKPRFTSSAFSSFPLEREPDGYDTEPMASPKKTTSPSSSLEAATTTTCTSSLAGFTCADLDAEECALFGFPPPTTTTTTTTFVIGATAPVFTSQQPVFEQQLLQQQQNVFTTPLVASAAATSMPVTAMFGSSSMPFTSMSGPAAGKLLSAPFPWTGPQAAMTTAIYGRLGTESTVQSMVHEDVAPVVISPVLAQPFEQRNYEQKNYALESQVPSRPSQKPTAAPSESFMSPLLLPQQAEQTKVVTPSNKHERQPQIKKTRVIIEPETYLCHLQRTCRTSPLFGVRLETAMQMLDAQWTFVRSLSTDEQERFGEECKQLASYLTKILARVDVNVNIKSSAATTTTPVKEKSPLFYHELKQRVGKRREQMEVMGGVLNQNNKAKNKAIVVVPAIVPALADVQKNPSDQKNVEGKISAPTSELPLQEPQQQQQRNVLENSTTAVSTVSSLWDLNSVRGLVILFLVWYLLESMPKIVFLFAQLEKLASL